MPMPSDTDGRKRHARPAPRHDGPYAALLVAGFAGRLAPMGGVDGPSMGKGLGTGPPCTGVPAYAPTQVPRAGPADVGAGPAITSIGGPIGRVGAIL